MKLTRLTLLILPIVFLACAGSECFAQEGRLRISQLDRLEAKASQSVKVDIDQRLLRIAEKFLSGKNADELKVKEIIAGIKGVYVRSFQIEIDNQYSTEDIQSITSQIESSNWSQIVDVHSKKDGQTVKVYMMLDGANRMNGLTVLATEARQFTIVNIVGPIDLEKLATLSGSFGIPKLDIESLTK